MLSVIIPSYNEERMIPQTIEVITNVLLGATIAFELIFVDDGSSDDTWFVISKYSQRHANIRGVRFSRNFGKEAAIFAGLENAQGDCCAVMDCDLQHPPETLVEMYSLWNQGYDIIEGVKSDRGKESPFYRFGARLFYETIKRLSGIDMKSASDFKLIDRQVVNVLLSFRERHTFFRALSKWVGFKTTSVEFVVKERSVGKTKWSLMNLMKYAIRNIALFSAAPMQVVTVIGVMFLIFSMILGIQTFYLNFIGRAAEGFTTVILLLLIIGSVIMICLGIIGFYLAQIYDEIKDRPRFITSDGSPNQKNQNERRDTKI